MTITDPWLLECGTPLQADKLLICLPPPNVGAARFSSWIEHLESDTAVIGVALPGVERRVFDEPLESVERAVEEWGGLGFVDM